MRFMKKHGFALGLILAAVLCLGISQAKAQTLEFCKNNAAAPECTETPAYETEDYMFGFDKYINRKQQPLKDDIAALQQQVAALQAALANTATTTQVNNLQQQITALQAAMNRPSVAALYDLNGSASFGDNAYLYYAGGGAYTVRFTQPLAAGGKYAAIASAKGLREGNCYVDDVNNIEVNIHCAAKPGGHMPSTFTVVVYYMP